MLFYALFHLILTRIHCGFLGRHEALGWETHSLAVLLSSVPFILGCAGPSVTLLPIMKVGLLFYLSLGHALVSATTLSLAECIQSNDFMYHHCDDGSRFICSSLASLLSSGFMYLTI